jgi:2Fe-2S ferredoxin
MVRVTFISHKGDAQTVNIDAGYSLMEGAKANDVADVAALCGGNAQCGTCLVYVDAEWQDKAGAASDIEQDLIHTLGEKEPSVRLSCQIRIVDALDGLVVRTPDRLY